MRYSMHNKNSVTLHIDPIERTLIFTRDHKLFGIIIKEQTLGIRVLCNKWLPFLAVTQNLKHSVHDLEFIPFTIKSTIKTLSTIRVQQALAAFSTPCTYTVHIFKGIKCHTSDIFHIRNLISEQLLTRQWKTNNLFTTNAR